MNSLRWICVLVVVTISIGSTLMLPNVALACSCEAGTLQEMKDRSDAVFEGTVTSVNQSTLSLIRSSAKGVKASFQVNEVWKGHVTPTIEVYSTGSGDTCGYEFQEGERYLVYARSTGNSLEVSLCSGTVLQSAASDHVAELGSGSLPPQPVEPIQQSSDQSWRHILLFISIGCLITIVFVIYRKRNIKLKSKT
ncbi:MAG: hypothetical protein ACQEXQ_18520 [Bacillota bacterium]